MVWIGIFTRRTLAILVAILGVVIHLPVHVANAQSSKANPVRAHGKTPKVIHGDTSLKFLHNGTFPSIDEIPSGPKGEVIRYGFALVTQTPKLLKEHVGNVLTCQNCHLGAGRVPHAAPFVGVYSLSIPSIEPRTIGSIPLKCESTPASDEV